MALATFFTGLPKESETNLSMIAYFYFENAICEVTVWNS